MSLDQALAFLLFVVVAAITPGPSNLMLMVAGARAGFVGGLPSLAGAVLGMTTMMVAARLGLGTLLQIVPQLVTIVKWAGAAMLLWLAWKIANAPPPGDPRAGDPVGFRGMVAFQSVNPKSWLVTISAASAYGREGSDVLVQAFELGALFALACLPSFAVWVGFGAALKAWLRDPVRSRRFNIAMAIALAASIVLVVR